MEAWKHRKLRHHSISGWRLSIYYSLCRNFPSIFFRLKVIQDFHAFAAVRKFFEVLGANMTPKNFVQISTPPEGTNLRNSAFR
jgi:hypothetical protein